MIQIDLSRHKLQLRDKVLRDDLAIRLLKGSSLAHLVSYNLIQLADLAARDHEFVEDQSSVHLPQYLRVCSDKSLRLQKSLHVSLTLGNRRLILIQHLIERLAGRDYGLQIFTECGRYQDVSSVGLEEALMHFLDDVILI